MRCPKCAQPLEEVGEVRIADDSTEAVLPVYLCERCTRQTSILGVDCEVALTFCVDAEGRLLDPQTFLPLDPEEN